MKPGIVKKLSLLCFFIACFTLIALTQVPDSYPTAGKASYYHHSLQGLETSNGENFNNHDFTAAHRTLPFNSIVSITNKLNGRNAIVRINDRGPFNKNRIVDLSHSAAKKINMIYPGVIPVNILVLTALDNIPITDSLLANNESLDCYGNKSGLNNICLYTWNSESLKHAIYMATSMALEYHLDTVLVRANGDIQNRKYQVIISGLKIADDIAFLIKRLKQDGYEDAGILINGEKAIQPANKKSTTN